MAATDAPRATYEAIEKTLTDFIVTYEAASKAKDASLINRTLTPDCKRRIVPKGFLEQMGVPSDMSFSNDTYHARFEQDLRVAWTTHTEIDNVVIDAKARKASATAKYNLEFIDGETIVLEFAWYLTFNEDASKVTDILEFLDTAAAPKFQAMVDARLEKLNAQAKE